MNLSVCCAVTTGLPVLSSINSSDFHSWEDQLLSTFHSEQLDEYAFSTGLPVLYCCSVCGLRGDWFSCLVFSGLSVAGVTRQESFRCIARPTSSAESILLWLFFFTWIFLCSFRHHFRTICRTEMANVKQTQQMIPLITREISLGQYVCELVLSVNVFDLDFGVQIDSIKQPIKSNSVGSGSMSHCRASSLYDHFDHCFVVFKHTQQSFLMWRSDGWGTPWDCLRLWIVWSGEQASRLFNNGSPRSIRFWVVFPTTETIRSHRSRAGNTTKPQSCIQRNDFWFGWTAWTWSLFLTHPTSWNKCMTSKNAQCFTRSRFWISKISCEVIVLKHSNCLYSHVWWIYEINRFRRLSQALVHFVIDRANLFTDHRISGLPIRAKYKHFRTIWEHYFDNSPTDFNSSSLKWWSSMHEVDTL